MIRAWSLLVLGLLMVPATVVASSLEENTNAAAASIVTQYAIKPATGADEVDSAWDQLLVQAAATRVTKGTVSAGLVVQQAKVEAARTDKQTGASPSASGTTTVSTKPGIPELLAFAIERGAVSKTVNATSATLSTSPYAMLTLLGTTDDAETYQNYGFLGRLGVSATFPISSNGDSNGLNTKEITGWSLKLKLIGDRSPRSTAFIDRWEREVRPLVQKKADAITGAESSIFNDRSNKALKAKVEGAAATTKTAIIKYLSTSTDGDEIKKQVVASLISNAISPLADEIRTVAAAKLSPSLKAAFENEEVNSKLQSIVNDIAKLPLLSLEYNDLKQASLSDISEIRLSYESRISPAPVDLIANGYFSFYNQPDSAKNQNKIKEYGATVSLEGKLKNGLWRNKADLDASMISISGSGSFTRQEGDTNRGNAQLRVEIPIGVGVSLPLAVTYASRTETSSKSEVRGNFGLTFDLQKLQALSQLL
jgi:hypothetical protein